MLTREQKRELYDETIDLCLKYGVHLKNMTISEDGLTERLFMTKAGKVAIQPQPKV